VFVAISFSLASVRRKRADGLQTAWATGNAMPPSAAVRAPLNDTPATPPAPAEVGASGSGVTWHNGTEWREGGAPSAPWNDPYAGATPIRLADGARPREARAPLDTPAAWHRAVDDEDARVRRYGRPATIVVIEVEGIDKLIERLGEDIGDRLLPAIAEAIRRETRGADRMAWLDRARFGVLLPETDEVAAVNFVERVRERCDLWLAAGAVSLRLVIGWASPAPEQRLADVVPIARRRLDEDRRIRPTADAEPDTNVA
jgi:diguanylate cyclase (GGDEF)-like protein